MAASIPAVKLRSGHSMPTIGVGTATYPRATPEIFQTAMLDAIALGYRHFDTAPRYETEQRLGEAVAEAVKKGLVKSREDLFITSKLWATDTHADRVVPALKLSLKNLQLDYLDLYLMHWPASLKSNEMKYPIDKEDIFPMDMKSVWEAMEECQKLGLAKSIGVCNFSCKKLEQLLSNAQIAPTINQVEMHPVWQQKKLIDFCKDKGIHVVAYSPLGSNNNPWGASSVMDCDVLKDIAAARGKSIAQVSLRWIYQQGSSFLFKSFNKERMKANMEIFDWELSKEDLDKISQIPQCKIVTGLEFVSVNGPFKSLDEMWDGEI